MTGDSTLLTEFKERADPSITFGDDSKGYTVGYGLISKDNVIIEEVALVDGLKHNLLSISQLCDKSNSVTFNFEACVMTNKKNNKVVLTGVRKGNVYLADLTHQMQNLSLVSSVRQVKMKVRYGTKRCPISTSRL